MLLLGHEQDERGREEYDGGLQGDGGVGRAAAERAFAYYRKHKIATVDAVVGRVEVAHGAFLEPEVIQKAAAM